MTSGMSLDDWWYNKRNLFAQETSMLIHLELALSAIDNILADDEETHDLVTARLRQKLSEAHAILTEAYDIASDLNDDTASKIRARLTRLPRDEEF